MKDFIRDKIQEARDQGRDIPLVMEEMLMHLAGAIDGDKPDEKPKEEPKQLEYSES